MNKDCGRCHGKGGREIILKGRGFFGGQLKEWKKCDTCHGSGVNPDYRSKSCRGCWRTIEYNSKTPSEKVPEYCPDCRTRLRNEKDREREARQQQQHQSHQQHQQREQRPSYDDKWQEKRCHGLKGGNGCKTGSLIRYRTDWNKVPDLCPNCFAGIKAQKAQRETDFLTGRCEKCGYETRYHKDKRPPKLCKKCFDEREASKRTKPCKHCGKEVVYYVGEKEFDFCRDCNNLRLRVDRQGNTFQAHAKDGTVLFTFGRCSAPRENRLDGDAVRRREWANRGCYWVEMPGHEHETFIIASNPVVDGFIQQSSHIDTSYSTAALRNGWQALAIAVVSSAD